MASSYLHLDFGGPLHLARVSASVREAAAPPHPPGAPPRLPAALVADRVAALLGGLAVTVPAAWDTVFVYCSKPNLATVYSTLVKRGADAGITVGPVAECVSLALDHGDEAAALGAAVGGALRAAGWHRVGATAYINTDWTAVTGPTPVALAVVGSDSARAPPSGARVALRVGASRVAPFTPDGALEAAGRLRPGQSPPAEARALGDALFGCVVVPLPALEEATAVGVVPSWAGDDRLLDAWREALGRADLAPPPLWIHVVPGDDDCDAAAAAAVAGEGLICPPACLLLPPVLPVVTAVGSAACSPLAEVVDALQSAAFPFWGGAPPVVAGVATRAAPAAAGGWAAASAGAPSPPLDDCWYLVPLPPGVGAAKCRPAAPEPGPELAAALRAAAAARKAAEEAAALPPPPVTRAVAAAGAEGLDVPVLSKRAVVSLVGVRAAKKPAPAAAAPAAKKRAPAAEKAASAVAPAEDVADVMARVRAAYAAGTQAKLTMEDLKSVLRGAGLKLGGKKADLVERVGAVILSGK